MRLSKSQIKQMSSFISLNLQDIRDFIDKNRDDYEKWLKEEEYKEMKIKQIYKSYVTISRNIRKIDKFEILFFGKELIKNVL